MRRQSRGLVVAQVAAVAAALLLGGCALDVGSPDSTQASPSPRSLASPDLATPSPSPVRPPVSPPQGNPPPD